MPANQFIDAPFRLGGTSAALGCLEATIKLGTDNGGGPCNIRLIECAERELNELIWTEQIELGLVSIGLESSSGDLSDEVLLRHPFVLISRRARLPLPRMFTPEYLGAARWVLPNINGELHPYIDAFFVANSLRYPGDVIRCDCISSTKALVRENDFLTLLPEAAVAAELSAGTLQFSPMIGQEIMWTGAARRLRRRRLSPRGMVLVQTIRKSHIARRQRADKFPPTAECCLSASNID